MRKKKQKLDARYRGAAEGTEGGALSGWNEGNPGQTEKAGEA